MSCGPDRREISQDRLSIGIAKQAVDDGVGEGFGGAIGVTEACRIDVQLHRGNGCQELEWGSVMHSALETLIVDPFLHSTEDRIDSPITGRTLRAGEADYAAVQGLLGGASPADLIPSVAAELESAGWLVHPQRDLARRFRLRVVSLETHTVCNQTCYFCPVSIAPRAAESMPDSLFGSIVHQLTAFRTTLEAVFLSSYNEPTIDPRLVEHSHHLMRENLPVALNTNATGLTPARVDQLASVGTLRLLSVNLSTLDRERYVRERGSDHLDLVLRNLDYARDRAVASETVIVVLGTGDATHHRDFETIRARFSGSRFQVQLHRIMDRAGRLSIGLKPNGEPHRLGGCENLGSRPLQHLHITPAGLCVFCCEDYDENYVVGDLRTMSIRDVLEGEALAGLRRWAYGLDEAPEDFICRQCIFARRR